MSRLFTYALCIVGGWFPGFVLGAFRVPEHTLKNDAFWLMASDVPALVGAFIGLIAALVMHLEDDAGAQEKAHEKRNAESRARTDAERARVLALRRLCSESQAAAARLPVVLAQAEIALDRADDELHVGLYSPFWEAMEEATRQLSAFEDDVRLIESRRTTHQMQAQLTSAAPPFSLGVSVLPDPAATHKRLVRLYRQAQLNRNYAFVYEQRRMSTILIAGFSSLGQAIEGLGDNTIAAITHLRTAVDCRLVSIESSLEASVSAAAKQTAALAEEMHRVGKTDAAVLDQLRQDSLLRSEHERVARRMLDNIQRRRKPSI